MRRKGPCRNRIISKLSIKTTLHRNRPPEGPRWIFGIFHGIFITWVVENGKAEINRRTYQRKRGKRAIVLRMNSGKMPVFDSFPFFLQLARILICRVSVNGYKLSKSVCFTKIPECNNIHLLFQHDSPRFLFSMGRFCLPRSQAYDKFFIHNTKNDPLGPSLVFVAKWSENSIQPCRCHAVFRRGLPFTGI